ncbi:chemotaxis protein, partial [Luteimonas sp. M1R5S59]|nr:chemotaxis protein [Luteimonas kalidii]
RVTDIIADISAASQEQSSGIEQVNVAITQMDEGTQQNAALVEEATAAARAMEGHAGDLVRTVAIFRTRAGAAAAATTPTSAPPAVGPRMATPTGATRAVAVPPQRTGRATATRPRDTAGANVVAEVAGEWQEF